MFAELLKMSALFRMLRKESRKRQLMLGFFDVSCIFYQPASK